MISYFSSIVELTTICLWFICFLIGILGFLLGIALGLSSKSKNVVEVDSKAKTKHFISCILQYNDGSELYRSYAVDIEGEYPSAEEVKMLRDGIAKQNPKVKDCTVVAISKLRG